MSAILSRQCLQYAALAAGAVLILCAAGCAHYQPAPLSPTQSAAALEARSLADTALRGFLEANLHRSLADWPLTNWDFEKLTLAAFYFHPSLDVARAQWSVAKAAAITAGARPNPTLSAGPQYAVDTKSGLLPWLAMVDLDIPIETAGKRGYRIAQARCLSQAARLNITSLAWQVRSNLRTPLLDFGSARKRAALLRLQIEIHEQAIRRLGQKVAVGVLASSDVLPYRIALQKAQIDLADAERSRLEARVRVAGAIGVPLQALDSVQLPESLPELSAQASQLTAAEARRLALHSRADILAALSDYEASQAALRLQIARQYPNINLGPGYEYDQGENKIGFKLAAELPVFYRNQGPIAEAKALRDEAAARFTALQARILCDIDRALTALRAAEQQFATVNLLLAAQRQQQESVQKQLAAGVAEPLDLLNAQLELMAGELAQHDALLKRQQALGQLEDAIQRPLNVDVAADVKRLSTKPKSE